GNVSVSTLFCRIVSTVTWISRGLLSQDSAASFAGEVQDPGRTFPRAMLYAILLVVLSSFFPVLVGTGAFRGSYQSWQAGYFVTVAGALRNAIVGCVLGWLADH